MFIIEEVGLRIGGYVHRFYVEKNNIVDGNITIQGVDFDYVTILLLNKNGEYGEFLGQKLSLDEFLGKYDKYSFEIVDELYGYNTVEYNGFLSILGQSECIEMTISIYHFGDIWYETDG